MVCSGEEGFTLLNGTDCIWLPIHSAIDILFVQF